MEETGGGRDQADAVERKFEAGEIVNKYLVISKRNHIFSGSQKQYSNA